MTAQADDIENEIAALEQKLRDAKLRLSQSQNTPPTLPHGLTNALPSSTSHLHALLLLSDSALPLGSFAFSSGLESYLAHHRAPAAQQPTLFARFLSQSLASLASTSLPYVLASWRDPTRLDALDNDFDASMPCPVGRRASVSQGRALVGVWDRSFKGAVELVTTEQVAAVGALKSFARKLRRVSSTVSLGDAFAPNAHLAPLWGCVTRVLDVDERSAAYLFLFSHARTVVSAAVRASVLGPYQAQAELASGELKQAIDKLLEEWWDTAPEDAGQVVPVMDLWVGRHEKLYSRIFNS